MATIMVIDDMGVFRDPIGLALRRGGHRVVLASNGHDAMDKLATERPDLILLDLAMPVMDGPSFLKALRDHPCHKDIPVIVLTAVSDHALKRQVTELGIADYMLKSRFSLRELLERAGRYLGAPAAAAGH
jgi:two-component system chemotaxis response regulator CheY